MITLIGAITVEQVMTTMTVNGGTDGRVFHDESHSDASSSFVVRSLCCCRQFTSTLSWQAFLLKGEAVGARLIYLSPYSPDFNQE